MIEEQPKKKRSGLRLVSRKSTKKMLGRWKKLDSSVDKSDTDSQLENEVILSSPQRQVLGESVATAVAADPSMDGLPLPAFFRITLDYVEAHGLCLEGIYRVSSPKSRLDDLERAVNAGETPQFLDAHEAAGLLKRFLRNVPHALAPEELERLADQCKCDFLKPCVCGATRAVKASLKCLPSSHFLLLAFVFHHAQHVVNMESENKMGIPALGLLLQQVLEMSRRMVCMLLLNASPLLQDVTSSDETKETHFLFDDVCITPYVPPRSAVEVESWLCEDKPLMEQELLKQQNVLAHLHNQISDMASRGEETAQKENDAWQVQTAITTLKRRLKAVAEPTAPKDPVEAPCVELFLEKQLLAVQTMLREDISEEKRRIAKLLLELERCVGVSNVNSCENEKNSDERPSDQPQNTTDEGQATGEEGERTEAESQEKEARKNLIVEVSKLRTDCAVLRAALEHGQQKPAICTRF